MVEIMPETFSYDGIRAKAHELPIPEIRNGGGGGGVHLFAIPIPYIIRCKNFDIANFIPSLTHL